MSEIRANSITDAAGTGAPNFPNGLESDGVAVATTADIPAAGGMTLLGTLTPTSGTSVTLSGLNLTGYECLLIEAANVVISSNDNLYFGLVLDFAIASNNITSSSFGNGNAVVFLRSGVYTSSISGTTTSGTGASTASVRVGRSNVTTASTSLTISTASATFTSGTLRIYGVK